LRDPLYANSYFLFANTILGALLGFVYWLIVARLFPSNEVGVGTAVISLATLLAGIANLGLGLGVIRFHNQMPKATRHALISSAITLSLIAAILVGGMYLLVMPLWSSDLLFLRHNPLWNLVFLLGVVAWSTAPIMDQTLLAHRAGVAVLGRNTVMHIVKLALPFVLVFAGGAVGVFASFAIGVTLSCAAGLYFVTLRSHRPYRFTFQIGELIRRKDILSYSLGNHIAQYVVSSPVVILPLVVLNRLGEAQTAHYYIAFMIASLLYSITTSLANSALVEGSSKEGDVSPLLKSAKVALLVMLPAMLAIYFAGPMLLRIFGPDYLNATKLLRVLVLATPLNALTVLAVTHWRIRKATRTLNVFSLVYAVGILGLSMLSTGLTQIGYAYIVGTLPALLFAFLALVNSYRKIHSRS
jgi:O-antigen/teichoic acid export membrane protein